MKFLKYFSFSKPPIKPFSAWQIELTTRCPLRCKMCVREGCKDWQGGDMSIDDFRRLLPYLNNVETVVLEGWGESLLHRDLAEIIRLVKGKNSRAGFVTSGTGPNKDSIKELIHRGVDFIGLSLSGTTPEMHNAIRVNSDFRVLTDLIRDIDEIKRRNQFTRPRLHIVYLMLRDNISGIPALPSLAKDLRIEEVVLINLIHVTNEWQDGQRVFTCNGGQVVKGSKNECVNSQTLEPTDTYLEFLKEAEARANELGIKLRRPSLSPVDVSVCEENPLRNLYISADGEVSPCVYLYPPLTSPFKRIFCGKEHRLEKVSFGNIFGEPFETIWNKKEYAEFRDAFYIRKRRREATHDGLLWDMETLKKCKGEPSLPDPPEQCRTCHKMLGV